MDLWNWDFNVPFVYDENGKDDIWQLVLTKAVVDTGWVLTNPFLGAPSIAHWHYHAAAQTSAFHSIFMLILSKVISNPIKIQQFYYVLNFALISLSTFFSCRLLKLSNLPAFCIAVMFSLLGYRFNFFFYSFLSNYSSVPLALVAVFWIMIGEFSNFNTEEGKISRFTLGRIFSTNKFYLGLFFILFVTISDGYYAFFTLLLLGFATVVRILSGDFKKPASLLVPLVYIGAMMMVALTITLPLKVYKHDHPEEFAPNGKRDPTLIKHAFEAEVYSTSLKQLLMPSQNHQIAILAELGRKISATSNAARLHQSHPPLVLGTLGSLLFISSLALLLVPALHRFSKKSDSSQKSVTDNELLWAAIALAFFIFLCSIFGGIGTLIALVYPTVRAYERFPLFLVFVLLIGAGSILTTILRQSRGRKYKMWVSLIIMVTILSIFDQIPRNVAKGSAVIRKRFLSERDFVAAIESKLPPGAMIYQFPYSQYLTNSDYYGWGSFAHLRLFLHSSTLRWSNGASKNSFVEGWHFQLQSLPLDNLITELESVGFSGFVIDRTVVKAKEYEELREVFKERSYEILEDTASKLTFIQLRDPGYRLAYDSTYRDLDHIQITDPALLVGNKLSRMIQKKPLMEHLEKQRGHQFSGIIHRAVNPEIFTDTLPLRRSTGQIAIVPTSDMVGQMSCKIETGRQKSEMSDTLLLTIKNQSRFDWSLGSGQLPIRIGAHILLADGKLASFDNGFRIPMDAIIKRGSSLTIKLPINSIPLNKELKSKAPLLAQLTLLQEGHAWFENINCTVPLR